MTITTTFDKNGDHLETIKAPEADPYKTFKNNINVKSLRIEFLNGDSIISKLSFYRVNFKLAQ